MYDEFKKSVGWDDKHMIGAHIRRTDLAIVDSSVRCPHPLCLAPWGCYISLTKGIISYGPYHLSTGLNEVLDTSAAVSPF